MRLPRKITPCPIHEAVIEIRFEPLLHEDAVFGVIYAAVKEMFPKVKSLPVVKIPSEIRKQEENLLHTPHYQMSNEQYIAQVGPRVLSLVTKGTYPGWVEFNNTFSKLFDRVIELNLIGKVVRLGIRYIDFFEHNILEKIDLQILMEGKQVLNPQTLFRTTLEIEGFSVLLQITNEATIAKGEGKVTRGSLFDVDVYRSELDADFFSVYRDLVNKAHMIEKELFFGLLKSNFLDELHPEY